MVKIDVSDETYLCETASNKEEHCSPFCHCSVIYK